MPRFFIRQNQIDNGKIHILGDDAHHISYSLRMAVGESVTACDMQGIEYDCKIESFSDGDVTLIIEDSRSSENEPKINIRLFQALPKGDKLDSVIQKSVECGVCEIIPFESERCIVKIEDKKKDGKIARWQAIAESAGKQSKRNYISTVCPVLTFKQAIEKAN